MRLYTAPVESLLPLPHPPRPQGALTLRVIPSNGASSRRAARHSRSNKQAHRGTYIASPPTSGGRHLRAIRLAARLIALSPSGGTMRNAGGGEALRVMLEKRASACVTIVSAIATREHVRN